LRINLVGAFIRNAPFGTEIAFQKGLRRLGHQLTLIDTSYPDQKWDHDADITIVFKWMEGYWEDLEKCGGKRVVYQPDDLRFPHIQQMMRSMLKYCDLALTFDDDGAQMARGFGYRGARKLLLTADDELYRPLPGVKKDIPICFIGSLTGGANHESRVRMCRIVEREFPGKFLCMSDVYDVEKIVYAYNRSMIVLNHATDVGQTFGTGYGYQCRHFEAGLTGTCVLSNRVLNGTELSAVREFDCEEELITKIKHLLRGEHEQFSHALYWELTKKHLPQHRASEMLTAISEMS
jgi:hypothetical protein